MKRELIWWTLFFGLAVVIVGQMTRFQFKNIDIQLHDTYYVIPPFIALLFILTIFGVLRGLVKITDRLCDRSKLVAISVTIINGLLGFVMIILIYVSIVSVLQIKEWYPDLNISNYLAIIALLTTVLCLLILIEFRTIKKLKAKGRDLLKRSPKT